MKHCKKTPNDSCDIITYVVIHYLIIEKSIILLNWNVLAYHHIDLSCLYNTVLTVLWSLIAMNKVIIFQRGNNSSSGCWWSDKTLKRLYFYIIPWLVPGWMGDFVYNSLNEIFSVVRILVSLLLYLSNLSCILQNH